MPRTAEPLPEVFRATPTLAPRVSCELKAGRVRRLAPGIYTTNVIEPLEKLVRRLIWPIANAVFPGAVIGDRTAFDGGPASDGSVCLTASAERNVELPGAMLRARKGPGPLPGDTPLLGLYMASRPAAA